MTCSAAPPKTPSVSTIAPRKPAAIEPPTTRQMGSRRGSSVDDDRLAVRGDERRRSARSTVRCGGWCSWSCSPSLMVIAVVVIAGSRGSTCSGAREGRVEGCGTVAMAGPAMSAASITRELGRRARGSWTNPTSQPPSASLRRAASATNDEVAGHVRPEAVVHVARSSTRSWSADGPVARGPQRSAAPRQRRSLPQ